MMTRIITGAYLWWLGRCVQPRKLSEWAETLKRNQLKFLLRRETVMPALDSDHVRQLRQWWRTSTVTPESLQLQMDASVPRCPRWEPTEDYTHYFMSSMESVRARAVCLLAVAELRWLASGGILSMASNENIRRDCHRREMVCSIPEGQTDTQTPERHVLIQFLTPRNVWTCWTASKVGTTTNYQTNLAIGQEVQLSH